MLQECKRSLNQETASTLAACDMQVDMFVYRGAEGASEPQADEPSSRREEIQEAAVVRGNRCDEEAQHVMASAESLAAAAGGSRFDQAGGRF